MPDAGFRISPLGDEAWPNLVYLFDRDGMPGEEALHRMYPQALQQHLLLFSFDAFGEHGMVEIAQKSDHVLQQA